MPASESHHSVREGKTTRRREGHAPIHATHNRCSSSAFSPSDDAEKTVEVADVVVVVANVVVVVVVVAVVVAPFAAC